MGRPNGEGPELLGWAGVAPERRRAAAEKALSPSRPLHLSIPGSYATRRFHRPAARPYHQ